MPACTECASHNRECYYDSKRSVKCAGCLEHQKECDGTFSLEEFRKVGETKKVLAAKSRRQRREIAKLRKALLEAQKALQEAEEEDVKLQDSLEHWEEVTDRMLRREMRALGVLREQPEDQEIALADPLEDSWAEAPFVEQIDWSEIWRSDGGNAEVPPV